MATNKYSRRTFLRLAAGVTAGAALAACEPETVVETVVQKETVVETVVEKQTVVEEKEVVVTATMDSSAKESVTLRYWHHWGGNRVPLQEEQIKRFMEKYPWIEVEMTLMPWDNRLQTLLTTIAAGDPVNVTMLGRQDVPSFVVQDALMPLDDFMDRDGITGDLFNPSEFRGCQYEGKTWILPLPTGGALSILWRNKGWIAEEGFDPETPPETWDDIFEMGRAITELENGSLQKAFFRPTVFSEPGWLIGWLYSNGGSWVSEDLRTVEFNSPEALEAMNFVVDYTNEINGGFEEQQIFFSQTGEWENGPFYSYFEAMQINGSWEFFKIEEYAPEIVPDLGVSAVPHGPSGESHGSAYGGWGYCVPRGAKYAEESWLLVNWLTTAQDGACWFLQQQKRPSPLISCNEHPDSGVGNPVWDDIIQAMSQDVWVPITPVQPEVEAIWDTASEEALFGVRTTEEALEWAATECQELLDDFWAEHS